MAAESVSFRITRNTEDLAQATHALSQRLVKLEQRLQATELQLAQLTDHSNEQQPAQLDSLENVERLLYDCRCLLGLEESPTPVSLDRSVADSDQQLAA